MSRTANQTDPRTARATALARGIVLTVAYGDVFDDPLTIDEVARYLPGTEATPDELQSAVAALPSIALQDGYLTLAGREELVATRRRRADAAARLWRLAERYGRFLGRLPFVRGVLISGALAVDSVEEGDDIDLLILARRRRVWSCRALVTGVARLTACWGVELCPNWVLSEDSLGLPEQTFYSARDLTQAVPVWSRKGYSRLRDANPWVDDLFPNASAPPRDLTAGDDRPGGLSRAVEWLLGGRCGDLVERTVARCQRRHLENKISRGQLPRGQAGFTADSFRGHFDGHATQVTEAFRARLAGLGEEPP